ncbi:SMB-1 family subclass B3 metallo-beta-lactamase [Permianibacter aggregans]|uniref:Metallo-beta-lactamase class B n=1 Tax=Permianibacter aggregans TaxID=1510150 RepID=A0A4R6UJ50_9GAMM|nr:SMB-1 family subclass B3 metallo-beta-lactamase [Permianibacter aggregans]QGX39692.1 SMB-1 family subclass B3 metallo-beta-lactamase [Permianibacter aggregans]TDQ43224.1 metallo-beta-lactamase class B [Permianibacter aggregans]
MKKFALTSLIAIAVTGVTHADRGWSDPQEPFTIYGNTHYVGTAGIAAVLITSPEGHVLIDGATEQGAKVIASNIRALGYNIEDVKYILSSHSHVDHAGGIAALQKWSGATVLGGAGNVDALRTGISPKHDPQFGGLPNFPGAENVHAIADGETVTLGSMVVTAHTTPGHTPGGISWTWQSCEDNDCKSVVFADSISAVSAKRYRFSEHPDVVASLQQSFAKVENLPCDILIAAHPQLNDLWGRQQRANTEGKSAYVDTGACRLLVEKARRGLAERLSAEKQSISAP